ncbi:nuclear transport factor 2 family protein [Streptomyces armeniacus]|uniref:Nuclear transport factor 2 family protein n=1 Tax=Streptomyces armeniacus TaxID=83291 RepID=A0A345XJG1_9ACTN|nr:nuclear transport factor 2 family protein [Streptomyces armeniacus]AXK31777.1 nuclear transport factor 2 family protein [Streptomyces armeniacus]
MEPLKVVEALWQRIEARDWAGAGELLAEDAVVEWPVTAERIVGRANFLAVNSEYPEGWEIRVRRIVADGVTVVSEVDVPHVEFGMFHAASFWTVRDGVVVRAREFWTSPGAEAAPAWRAPYVEPM